MIEGGHCLVPLKHSNSLVVCHRDTSGQTHNVSGSTLLTYFFFHWDSHPFRPFFFANKQFLMKEKALMITVSKAKAHFSIFRHSLSLSEIRNCLLCLYMCIKTNTKSLAMRFPSLPFTSCLHCILPQFRHYSIHS